MKKDYFDKRKIDENANIQTLKTWTREEDRNSCTSILVLTTHKKKKSFFKNFLNPRTDAQPGSISIEITQSEVFLFSSVMFPCSVLSWALTYTKSVHFNVPITTKTLFHNQHQLQNLIFQVSFLFIINYLKTTYFFIINNKICSRLRILRTPYLSHHHSPRLHIFLQNQDT